MMGKQMSLGLFLMGTGHHIASWRHKNVPADGSEDIRFFQNLASIAERGKFDMLFLSDGLSFNGLSHPAELVRFEPFTLLGYLSAVTTQIGLAATASTTYNEPFHIARKFSSLDHLNDGRTAWNVVTSYYESEAGNFNRDNHLDHSVRYDKAFEFVEVVKGLWDSWEEDALVRNKETGVYFDNEKLHALNHKGNYFSVEGPLNSSRSPQGRPVIIQAGSSDAGTSLAAKTADVIFTAQQTLEEAQAFYAMVKNKAIEYGRLPDQIKIMPGVSPIVGRTEKEAREKYQQLQELIVPEIGLAFLSDYLGGLDFSNYSLDDRLPEYIPETNGNQSRRQLIIDLARREKLTIRQLYQKVAGSRGHRIIFGNPEQIADQLEEWIDKGGADGFNLMMPTFPDALEDFVDLVVPILQERGVFRKDYQGSTLREYLGLSKPESSYSKKYVQH
ncbi:LLM class flavin-dependent oxidoreductase [Peribacillus psychrosaccharolyticus]|uniref:LLM class flavin-dependent oxidoreductase n=1 Tax=Peribacillus psychrosaccharolyticus TaxID=1407 RepID=A0A974NJ51_PERPY|nr:LLM class flavin-dependent oxidoreductase [Peribacillus psychrosaccharolyticus]MEC2057883.1 LLM class flavin-dependent oxidoreductase [Peribacillus psychrosaccharolyticus]MED3744574.1 LLM class flavin-dependent oxidoreductase [Peribacillus psychrosaccharolyticus]QQS98695.1 LLM class flavin-dependent oxidoreductase [Peribacillus psychrosaccharolyticus]